MKPRTEATTEMEASEERMSREDGMRYCYQTATFYLFMPGSQERSARVLEGRMLCPTGCALQTVSSSIGDTGPASWFKVMPATARLYDRVQGT